MVHLCRHFALFAGAMNCSALSVARTIALMDSTYLRERRHIGHMKRYKQHSMFCFLGLTLRSYLSPRGSAQRLPFCLSAMPLCLSAMPLLTATGYKMGLVLLLVVNSIVTLDEFEIIICLLRLCYSQIPCPRTLGIGPAHRIKVVRKVSQGAHLWRYIHGCF